MSGQDCEQLTLFQAGFHASHIPSSVKGLQKTMIDTCGLNLCVLSKNFGQEPLWVKMCLAYYLRFMVPFAPTWKMRTTKSGRSVYRLTLSVPTMKDIGWLLLPSPRASRDYKPIRAQTPQEHNGKHGNALCSGIGVICPERNGIQAAVILCAPRQRAASLTKEDCGIEKNSLL